MTVFAQDLSVRASKGYTLKPDAPAIGATSYTWYEDGNLLTGKNEASLTIEAETKAAGTYAYWRVAANEDCPDGVASNTFIVRVCTNQEQGGCTYTEPAPVSTFANFVPSSYTSSTSLSLTDERDNKIYPVVKIGGRWIMARNLNYQEGLAFNSASNKPVTTSGGSVRNLMSQFWCPGGNSSTASTSTQGSCDVWGALYTWETAMMLDGKGTWEEAGTSTYNKGAANAEGSKTNQGRKALTGNDHEGRGICPVNWHVPTDNEWGKILDAMEDNGTGTGVNHQDAESSNWYGTYAGKFGKSTCTTASSSGTGVDDTHAYWYYNTDPTKGTDEYGFRVLPAGRRYYNGSYFVNRGSHAFFWSSSATSGSDAWIRYFSYNEASVYRAYYYRSYGFSVRCIRDSD
jgi:uncharacterized protein (TIGR02145 family)